MAWSWSILLDWWSPPAIGSNLPDLVGNILGRWVTWTSSALAAHPPSGAVWTLPPHEVQPASRGGLPGCGAWSQHTRDFRRWMRTRVARPPYQVECSCQTTKVPSLSRAPHTPFCRLFPVSPPHLRVCGRRRRGGRYCWGLKYCWREGGMFKLSDNPLVKRRNKKPKPTKQNPKTNKTTTTSKTERVPKTPSSPHLMHIYSLNLTSPAQGSLLSCMCSCDDSCTCIADEEKILHWHWPATHFQNVQQNMELHETT